MAQVPVVNLIKRIRDITDMDGDQFVEDAVLLRWLNNAVPRLDAMIARAGWVMRTALDAGDATTDIVNGALTLEEPALAILGVYELISDTQYRPLRSTTIEDTPFPISLGTRATRYFVSDDATDPVGGTVVNLRPVPVTGSYYVLYIPQPVRLIKPGRGSVAAGPMTASVDGAASTYTRLTGDFLDDGFEAGQYVTWLGFVASANNETVEITDISSDTMTVFSPAGVTTETGSGDETVTLAIAGQQNYVIYPSGWEEWLVLEVARQVGGREESTNSNIEQRKLEIEREISQMAMERLFAQGPRVRDTRAAELDSWTLSAAMFNPANWLWC